MAPVQLRPFDVVIFGATSFTGKLVAEHIARDYQGKIKWAMAGRNLQKLEGVRNELSKVNPAVRDVPLLIADAMDRASLSEMVKKTQVVLSTTGPFAAYGDAVVEQAVQAGTNYCDITGEIPWVKRSILKHHADAEKAGVKIVHCCGYDSIPSDLGTLMMVDHCKKKLGKKVKKVFTLVQGGSGGFSGGTIASAMYTVQSEPTSELMKVGSDQYYLAGLHNPQIKGSDKPAPFLPTFLPEPGVWAGPFVMEGVNAKVVQASNALAPQGPYGTDFEYREMTSGGQGWTGFGVAGLVSLGTTLVGAGFALGPARWLLKKVLPAPGQGPSLEQRMTGHWSHKLVAVTEEGGQKVTGMVGDKRDPGYWSTSRMLLEAGLALVLDAEKITASGECRAAGVLTPASAMGMVLVERLRRAGFTWRVDGA